MWKHFTALLFVTVYSSACIGHKLTQWHMGSLCGLTIPRGLPSGELVFRADDFLSSFNGTCTVVINLDDDSRVRERTVLYFTEFKLDTNCSDYVTVVNGDMSGEWNGNPSARDVVEGLPKKLCGHNKSLEESEVRFFTRNHIFTVIYHRTGSLPWNNETFVMKFASYHNGECNTNRYYKCGNFRCIAKNLRCHGDIEACGERDSNCFQSGETKTFILSERIKDILTPFIILVVGCIVLLYIFKECKRRHGSVRNFPIIRDYFSNTQNPSSCQQIPESASLTPARDDDVQVTVVGETEVDQSISSAASFSNDDAMSLFDNTSSLSPPEYHTLNANNNVTSSVGVDDFTSPSAPDYVITDTSGFPPPPSYDQVMSNLDVYRYNEQN